MDPDLLLITVSSLVFVALLLGAVLLFPLSRKLAELLQLRIEEKKEATVQDVQDVQRIRATLSAHETQLAAVIEKQEFLESLLAERRAADALDSGQAHEDA